MSSWKNRILCFLVIGMVLTVASAYAQREFDPESNPAFKDRMYYGGNLGLQFGTFTLIDISPLAGVMLNSKLSAGLGATYQYYDDRRFQGSTGSSYGGRVFARHNILPNIFAYSEFESINWNAYNYFNDRFQRTWTDAFFIGAGYFTPFGPRGGANFTFLYNLMHDNRNSYYNEPYVIRVGFVL
jgi:hypothetical protein